MYYFLHRRLCSNVFLLNETRDAYLYLHNYTNLIWLRSTGNYLFDFCQVQDWNEKYGEVKKSKKGKKNAGSHMSLYI